jgi:thiol-disulfide isomerase/thioredoxin
MAGITDLFFRFFNPKKPTLWIFLVVILLISGGLFIYNRSKHIVFQTPEINNVPNANSSPKEMVFNYFFADWCPHCQKATKPWQLFKNNYENKVVDGYRIICRDYDCSNPNQNSELTTKMGIYDVSGYPTIKVDKDGKIVDFDAKITEYSLSQFIKTII